MMELLDGATILHDKIDESIQIVMNSEVITKEIEFGLTASTVTGWDIRKALGSKPFQEFKTLVEEYTEPSKLGIKIVNDYTWLLISNEVTKTYTYSIESLEEIENEIRKGELQTESYVRANKFEVTGWPMIDSQLKHMFFKIYNKLKEEDPKFSRKIYKLNNTWWLVDSSVKVQPDEESQKKIDIRKQKLQDRKNRIIWVNGSRYKVEDGVSVDDAESTARIANISWVQDSNGYLSDGMSFSVGDVISIHDDESGTRIYATRID